MLVMAITAISGEFASDFYFAFAAIEALGAQS
jgi:hypothetical protein